MFFSPLLSIVPSVATAPALIVVGIFMITPILKINWLDYEEAIPAFLSIILIPLTFSINQGISWGLLCWTILKLFVGKAREITPMLIILDFFAIVVLIIE
jgi:AGZA family xanthine/uracil permease-like MFS transporter